jgi:putative metallohydrolase (TIGR04338 family)
VVSDVAVRDNQRQRVYDAEQAAWARMMPEGKKSYHQTIPNSELAAFVNDVLDKRPVRSRWGTRTLSVEFTHGGARAHGNHSVRFGAKTRNELIVCHEIAHTLTPSVRAAHGPEFVGVYLFLVRTVMGPEWAKTLSDCFREQKVRRSNADVLPVLKVGIPKSRKEREAARRPLLRVEAITKIDRWVKDGIVRKADLKRLAEGKVAA